MVPLWRMLLVGSIGCGLCGIAVWVCWACAVSHVLPYSVLSYCRPTVDYGTQVWHICCLKASGCCFAGTCGKRGMTYGKFDVKSPYRCIVLLCKHPLPAVAYCFTHGSYSANTANSLCFLNSCALGLGLGNHCRLFNGRIRFRWIYRCEETKKASIRWMPFLNRYILVICNLTILLQHMSREARWPCGAPALRRL